MCKIKGYKGQEVEVELVEFGDISGLILNYELSKRGFKNMSQVAKIGSFHSCLVLKVDEAKGFIDLSLKRPSEDEKENCKSLFGKNKLAYQIMFKTAKILKD